MLKQKVKLLISLFLDFLYKYKNTNKKQLYFINIWGQYNDNTKALAEYFHHNHPDYKLIYECSDTQNKSIPEYIICVKKGSSESRKLKYTSAVIIDNDWGAIKKAGKGTIGHLFAFLFKLTISKNALYISTGHGTPLKKIGCDSVSSKYDYFVSSTKYMIVLDDHLANVSRRISMNCIQNYLNFGSPRNDCLFALRNEKELQKERFGLKGKKLLLFAPTFRTVVDENGSNVFLSAESYIDEIIQNEATIKQTLFERFGGEWVIGVRVHPGVTKQCEFQNLNNIFIANESNDMADYLMICDFLITDYSSSCFDYMLTNKPCLLFWKDYDDYSEVERGLYFSEEELPFSVCFSLNGILNAIKSFDEASYESRVRLFRNNYHFSNETCSSKRIADFIEGQLNEDC